MNILTKAFTVLMLLIAASLFSTAQAKQSVPWVIYFYLVGSDLESSSLEDGGGSATRDLVEIAESAAGSNVKFLVLTGGAGQWHNDVVSSKKNQMFEVTGGDLKLLKEWPQANMGDSSTLARFLKTGESLYQPEHRMIIFWDHGGGPTGGVGYDENFNSDFLKLSEITAAFKNVYSQNSTPFEIIGFDACLMGSMSSAYHMLGWGHVMIASEESEPSLGWNYTKWLNALEKKPQMSLRELSKNIVDTYVEACDENDSGGAVTLSAVNLDAFPELAIAYNEFGVGVLDAVSEDEDYVTQIERAANKVQNFGLKNKDEGQYSDVVDLGAMVNGISFFASDEAKTLEKALKKFVVYNRTGPYITGTGVSVYYPVGKGRDNFNFVTSNGLNTPMNLIYGLQLNTLNEKGFSNMADNIEKVDNYLRKMQEMTSPYAATYVDNYTSTATAPRHQEDEVSSGRQSSGSLMASITQNASQMTTSSATSQNTSKDNIAKLEDIAISFDKDNNAFVDIPKDIMKSISQVEMVMLLYEFPSEEMKDGILITLGSDVQREIDWENGRITDSVNGKWAAMDGHPLPITVANESDDYVTYDCHVKINGILHNMTIVFNYETQKYSILGIARLNENGVPDRNSRKLKPGDKITTVFGVQTLTGDDEEVNADIDTFEYTKDTKIEDTDLGESNVLYAFTFSDAYGNSSQSEIVALTIDDQNELSVEKFSDIIKKYEENGGASDSNDDGDAGDDDDDEEKENDEDEGDDEE